MLVVLIKDVLTEKTNRAVSFPDLCSFLLNLNHQHCYIWYSDINVYWLWRDYEQGNGLRCDLGSEGCWVVRQERSIMCAFKPQPPHNRVKPAPWIKWKQNQSGVQRGSLISSWFPLHWHNRHLYISMYLLTFQITNIWKIAAERVVSCTGQTEGWQSTRPMCS